MDSEQKIKASFSRRAILDKGPLTLKASAHRILLIVPTFNLSMKSQRVTMKSSCTFLW